MNDCRTRLRAGIVQQMAGWAIAFTNLLMLIWIALSYFDYQLFADTTYSKNIVNIVILLSSYVVLFFTVGNRTMKLGFCILFLSMAFGMGLNDILHITDNETLKLIIDEIQWLLFFAGLAIICLSGDICKRFPKLSTAYLFVMGSTPIIRLTYQAIVDNKLFWFVDRSSMFLWVDAIYAIARGVIAILFWIIVLRCSYPDNGRVHVGSMAVSAIIAVASAIIISELVFHLLIPMMS